MSTLNVIKKYSSADMTKVAGSGRTTRARVLIMLKQRQL